jgi:hypothetical protein
MRPGHHGDSLILVRTAAPEVLWIEVVEHRMACDDVDPADRVDHVDEADQADPDVVIDMDAKVVLDRGNRRARTSV